MRAPSFVSWISLALIMCGPVSNGFFYGIKSKTIQMTFVHFARKQMYKNEVGVRQSDQTWLGRFKKSMPIHQTLPAH